MGKITKAIGIASTVLCIGALGFVGVSAGLAAENGKHCVVDEWHSWGEHRVINDEQTSTDDATTDNDAVDTPAEDLDAGDGTVGDAEEVLNVESEGQQVMLSYAL